jgi:hypothetical protein
MSERWPGGLISKTPVTPGGPAPTSTAPGIWTLDQMNYWIARGLWPSASADPYWSYVSYLLSTTATNAQTNNTFLDSSTNNFTITRNGTPTQGSVTPYGTLWSNYFNGSSYLTSATATAQGSGDFTVEGWFYITNASSGPVLFDQRPTSTNGAYPCVYITTSATLNYYTNSADQIVGATTISLNTWHHFAVARSGSSTKLFLDGVQQGSTYTDTNTYLMGASRPAIAASGYNTALNNLTGYVSNIRFVNGTALYISAFTPPSAPLTAVSGTSLLTCQNNRLIDSSSNAFAITATGSPQVTAFSPFVLAPPGYTTTAYGGSGYFNGSGDYLTSATNTALGSGDFTVEGWFNMPSIGSTRIMYDCRPTGTGGAYPVIYVDLNGYLSLYANSVDLIKSTNVVPLNAWHHFALCRASGSTRLFLDGVQQGSTYSDANNYLMGTSRPAIGTDGATLGTNNFTGYLSNIRSVVGTALYTATFTPPTAPLTAITNTSLLLNFTNAGIYDASMNNDAVTVGSTQVSTTQAKYGTTSAKFNGTTDGLLCSATTPAALINGNFTWECWAYFSALTGNPCLINVGSTDNDRTLLYFDATNGIRYVVARGGADQVSIQQGATTGWSTNTWYHIALVRNGNNYAIYRDGTSVASGTSTYAQSILTSGFSFGYSSSSGTKLYFNGYLDDIRITNGYARYTTSFTPPTAALPVY